MSALSPQTLFEQEKCIACYGASLTDILKVALWDTIAQRGPVASFIDRAGITDATQIAALNALVLAAKTNGWWDKCDLIYPFVGGTAQAHAQNLKSESFNITWYGAVTHDANGVTGDGLSGYGDPGYNPASSGQITLNSVSIGVYLRVPGTSSLHAYLGCFIGGKGLFFVRENAATSMAGDLNDNSFATFVGADSLKWVMLARISSAQKHAYSSAGDFTIAGTSTGIPNLTAYILARNLAGAVGFIDANVSGITLGSGLTFAEYTLMAADWQAFQTTLGRQV